MAVALRPDLHQAPILRKSMNDIGYAGPDIDSAPASGGTAMPEAVQVKMEQSFGADFSAVRIHEGPQAPAIGALAYTQGTDIHFAPGQYAPSSQGGQELLGHELAHVVQQAQGWVGATMQTKGAAVNDDSTLEREADQMGARAARGLPTSGAREPGHAGAVGAPGARGQRATGTTGSGGAVRAGQASVPMSTSSSPMAAASTPVVQAKPADERPLEENAEKDAAALLRAFQGLGTDDQAVYRVLNQPSEMVQAIERAYDAHYNQHRGRGLVEDLRAEFDHLGSQDDWHFVLGQLTRAGIAVPDAALPYQRQDPAAEHQGGARIVASPDVRVAVPKTRITYTLAHGNQGLHAASAPYRYQWYALNDPVTSRLLRKPARVEGGDGPKTEATARFVGNHKIISKVTPRSGRGAGLPTFYEFPQTVVPEGKLAQDALQQAPEAVDPARQLEILETFLQVLRAAEKQPGSAPLDAGTTQSYEKQIAALRKRLASTEGAERIPIQAVHVDREKARVSPLRAFVAPTPAGAGTSGDSGALETWRLVDITNPESRRLSGEYEGTGKNAREAILAALAAWDTANRYAAGRIQLEVGAEAAGAPIAHTFQTDGMSFWDSIGEFFAEVGFWTGMGALAAGVVTAVVPVPGMRVVSGLIWTSILTSTVASTINLAQRHAEGHATAREDAMDLLSIAGNILAGTWLSRARVLLNGQGGTKIGTGLLIGQLGTDGAQGIVLGIEYLEQYDRAMAIEDPKRRTDALMELLRSAALAGGMLFLSVQGAKADLGHLGASGAQGGPARPGSNGPSALGNLAANSDAAATAPPRAGQATSSARTETSEVKAPEAKTPETKAPKASEVKPAEGKVSESTAAAEPPRVLDELSTRLSPWGREGLEQQKILLSPRRFQQMENAYRNPDGSYDIARANKIFESKRLDETAYQVRRSKVETELLAEVDENIGTIENVVADTNGTRRPGATLGDRTSETALLWEVENGMPYKSPQGHYLKVSNAIGTIQETITALQSYRSRISGEQARIDSAIRSGTARVNSMRPVLDRWNARATDRPDLWNPDGTSRVQPGWPADPGPK